MHDALQYQLQLPGATLLLFCAVALLAGRVRGFSGFGLSAPRRHETPGSRAWQEQKLAGKTNCSYSQSDTLALK